MDKFKVGDAGVVNKEITYMCGAVKVHKGSIVKIIDYNISFCIIYRNKKSEQKKDYLSIPTSCIDVPENMELMKKNFELGIKNIKQ